MKFLMNSLRSIVSLLVIGFAFIGMACAHVDLTKYGKIIFSNGRIIEYEPKQTVNKPEDSKKNVSIEKKPTYVKSWHRIILFTKAMYIEDSTTEISVYDDNGNLIYQSQPFIGGESLFLLKTERILLIQISSHHKVEKSYVIDVDGNIIRSILHTPNVFSFGKSIDDKTWWIMENGIEDGDPYILTTIYDFNGLKIDRFKSFSSTGVTYKYKRKKYSIHIPQPDFPG